MNMIRFIGWVGIAVMLVSLVIGCNGLPPVEIDCRILGCPAGYHCELLPSGVYTCAPDPPVPPPDCRTQGCPAGYQCMAQPDSTYACTQEHPPITDCRVAPGCPEGYHCELKHGTEEFMCYKDDPPPPPQDNCPKKLAEGAYTYLNNKPYGQGLDSTVRVHGDPEFCQMIHGVPVDDCHLEGWPTRVQCEMELIGGCPIWQFQATGTQAACVDDHDAKMSCDHFGSVEYRDDPQTPTIGTTLETLKGFEGQPQECGLQRDTNGPMAGFFTVAHGLGQVRACKPDGTGCGPWKAVDH